MAFEAMRQPSHFAPNELAVGLSDEYGRLLQHDYSNDHWTKYDRNEGSARHGRHFPSD